MRIPTLIAILFLSVWGLSACKGTEAPAVVEISREEYVRTAPGSSLVLDVRTPEEFAAGHVENALNIPHDRLAERLPEIQKFATAPVVVYCKSGRRAGLATELLAEAGFTNLRHLTGDMDGWIAAGYPVAKDGS